MPRSDTVQSVQRALDILEAVAHSDDGLRLNEIAQRLGLKKPTAHNLLRTLRIRGYVAKDSANRYRLGPGIDEVGRQRAGRAIARRAEISVRQLHGEIAGATVTFSELVGTEIYCRLRMAPESPGHLQRPQSQTFSAFGSASGLCLQAFNAGYRDAMTVVGAFEESGQCHWTTRADLQEARADAVRRGMAVIPGKPIWRLAAPAGDNYVLGLSLKMNGRHHQSVFDALRKAAAAIAADS